MKEQLSVNRAGHMMSEPRSLNDLAEVLHHERRETHAHWDGVLSQHGRAVDLFASAEAFVKAVPHAPCDVSAAELTKQYRAAVTRYHEGMAQALNALKTMQSSAEAGLRQLEAATAIAKQQRTSGALARGRLARH